MKDVPSYINFIVAQGKFSSKQDLLFLLNRIKGDVDDPIKMEDLGLVLSNINQCYSKIYLPKKNGAIRTIYAPNDLLGEIQSYLLLFFQSIYKESHTPSCVYGFVENRNIVQNASSHVGKKFVLNIDLSDFFGSISRDKICLYLSRKPFSIPKKNVLNKLIVDLVTYNEILPQGAPTSPILSNIVCQDLDFALINLAKKYNLKYTRYADDMTFSTNWDIDFPSVINTITQKCKKHGFKVNKKKTRLRDRYSRQLVTGLVVNEKVNLKKEFVKSTKAMLHNWEKLGLGEAQQIFEQHYHKGPEFDIRNVVRGRIDFIGLVLNSKGEKDNSTYRKLIQKYVVLAKCIDFDYVSVESYKKRLIKLNVEGEFLAFEADRRISKRERFYKYCSICFQQIEVMYKYYYLEKFDHNYSKIGAYFFENSSSFKKQMIPKKSSELITDKEEFGSKQASGITSFKEIKANQLQEVYIKDNYINSGRIIPFALDMTRQIRNSYLHGRKLFKYSEEELRQKKQLTDEIMEKAKANGQKRQLTSDETKVVRLLRKYDWVNDTPFGDIREVLYEVSKSIEFLIRDKEVVS